MTHELTLVSAEDAASLRLALPAGGNGSLVATASGPGFTVNAPVYTYMVSSLPAFLESLLQTPSAGTKDLTWSTLEGELTLNARLDSLGHVFLTYTLRSPDIGSNRWWSFTGRLVLEIGTLPMACRRAHELWQAVPHDQ